MSDKPKIVSQTAGQIVLIEVGQRSILENIQSNIDVFTREATGDEILIDSVMLDDDNAREFIFDQLGIEEGTYQAALLQASKFISLYC